MPFNLGGPELVIILAIVLIVFGAGKLPNVMRDFGAGLREFRKAQTEDEATPATPVAAAPKAPAVSASASVNRSEPVVQDTAPRA